MNIRKAAVKEIVPAADLGTKDLVWTLSGVEISLESAVYNFVGFV
jgi:hypothetical protein